MNELTVKLRKAFRRVATDTLVSIGRQMGINLYPQDTVVQHINLAKTTTANEVYESLDKTLALVSTSMKNRKAIVKRAKKKR